MTKVTQQTQPNQSGINVSEINKNTTLSTSSSQHKVGI